MKYGIRRLVAALLLLCTFCSFAVPATFAEDEEDTITYDFKLYNNEALIGDSTAGTISGKNIYAYSTKYNGSSRVYEWLVSNYGTDAVNWGLEGAIGEYPNSNYGTAAKTFEFHGANDRGMVLRLTTAAEKYAAIRIKVPAEGTYAVSVEGSYASVPANNLDVYIFPATTDFTKTTVMHDPYSDTDTVATENQISTYLTAENKVGTVETTAANMNCNVGVKNFPTAGDYIVVFKTNEEGLSYKFAYLSNMKLRKVAGEIPETSQTTTEITTVAGTTTENTTQETTQAPAGELETQVYDFKLYNNEALLADSNTGVISGANINPWSTKYDGTSRLYTWMLQNYGTEALNWGIEDSSAEIASTNYRTLIKNFEFHGQTDRGMVLKLTTAAEKWAAIRIKVPEAGTYTVSIEGAYTGFPADNLDMYIFPATTDFTETTVMHDPYSDTDTVAAENQISTYLTDANKVGTVETTAANMKCNVGQKSFPTAGDYIVVFKTNSEGLSYKFAYLSKLTLIAPSEEEEPTTEAPTEETTEDPTQETIDTSNGYIDGYYNLALYEDAAFMASFMKDGAFTDKHYNSGCYECGKTIANCLAEKYASNQTNWIIEGTSFSQQTFMAINSQGLRLRYSAGTSKDGPDNWIALRVKVNTPGTYTVTAVKDFANQVYNAQVFVFPAAAETMSADTLTAAMTEENTVGYLYFPKAAATRQAGEWTFETAGEYIIALKNVDGSTRMYLDQIALTAVEVEAPKTPVDKMLYDFGLDTMDKNFFGCSIYNKYAGSGSVKDKIDELYAADTLQWKYENRSSATDTGNQYRFRDDAIRFKTSANYKDYDKWWIAFRLDSPGAGTYDVRLTTALAGKAVANVYLIPATKNTMRPEDLQKAMNADNMLVQRAIFDAKDTFYLGEYTFGTANEYVMVVEFTKGTLFYMSSMEMTKDGLKADGTVKKEKVYNGTVYNLALNDAMDGVFAGSKHMVADKLTEMNALYRSGEINWNYVATCDRLSAGDKPSEYLRFYQATGLRMYGQVDDWMAIKIKSPGSGSFTVSLNHATGYEAGTIAMYVLPADTPKEDIWAATDPSNRIGKVRLTNETGAAVIEPGHTSFVGYYNFEAGKEYILVLEVYETSEFASTKCYVNMSQIIMERGIINYEVEQEKKAKPIVVEDTLAQIGEARSTGAVAEVNGHDYYYLPLEGKVMGVYDLTIGKLVDEVETTDRHPRAIAVGPDGTVWLGSTSKCLAWYDPYTQEYNTSPSFINIKGLEMLQQIISISMSDDGKMLYMTCYPDAYLVSYNIETKEFHNYGRLIEKDSLSISDGEYYNGYVYAAYYTYPDPWATIIKVDPATGEIVASQDLSLEYFPEGASITRLCVLGDDYLLVGGSALPNAIVMDLDTLELQETSLLGGIHYGVTEVIDGKQYMVVQGLGLHQYDVETKEFSKVPGFGNSGSGFLCNLTPWSKSSATIDGEFCLFNFINAGGHPRLYKMESQEIFDWKSLVVGIGGTPDIRAFINGPEGSNEIYVGFYNSEYCAVYNTEEARVTYRYKTGGQTDSQIWYEGKLYCGNYSSTTLNEIELVPADEATDPPTNEFIQRWKLDHELTGQMRIHCLAAGDGYVFAGTIPNTNLTGGSVTVYNTKTGKWSTKRHVVQDQSILSLAYHDKLLYGTSSIEGGQNAVPVEGTSAVVFVYDYYNEEVLATLDPRDYIPGLPNTVNALFGIAPDPKADENGRIWVIVGQGLMCFTFDRETKTFDVQQVIQFHTDTIDISGSQGWMDKNILFDLETNSIYVCLQTYGGFRRIELADWDAPVGSIRVKNSERIMSMTPIRYVMAEDGDLYYAGGNILYMLPLNVTDEDWEIAGQVDQMILDLGNEITLESETAIKEARSAYENLSWHYKALVQNLELLKEKECDLLECKVATLEGVEMTADDYPAMQTLMDTYKAMDSRQQRYVKNYELLKTAYDTASDLNDQRIAAAMQKKINALKDKFPLTLDDEPAVLEVRAEFDALTGSQQILVDTTILVDAESQIAVLRAELVKHAEELIQAIPDEITLDAESAIVAAREVVEKLYTEELKQISYAKYDNAEGKLRSLKNAKAAAEATDALIKEIGIVTLGDKTRIAEARAAYNKLNEAGRNFLTKEKKLLRAEFILKALQTWGIPAITVVNAGVVFAVIWLVPSLHAKVFKTKKKEEEPAEN